MYVCICKEELANQFICNRDRIACTQYSSCVCVCNHNIVNESMNACIRSLLGVCMFLNTDIIVCA